ncbi:M48 family metallopeptidase [Caulobacter sp. DWR1-3-2b1]|uniref:M48 family metallopeptidase n=1 Tax=Caulobacter sp. DWR1-3-2b1 TaxID=2804670 RepID=UPI003CEED387
MEGLLYDGLTSRAWRVEIGLQAGRVTAQALDDPHVGIDWPLEEVREAAHAAGRYRLTRGDDDARLVVEIQPWRAFSGRSANAIARRGRGTEWGLIAGLVGAGATLAAVVFVGVPRAAGPLAAWTPPALEARFGSNMEAQFKVAFRPCKGDPSGAAILSDLGDRLAEGSTSAFDIRVQAVRAPFVNAFALPGGAILVTDDLIAQARTSDELAAVIAHEIAHVERRHAMQAAWRSMGAGLLLDAVVGGGTGAGQQAVLLAGGFADQRFSRDLETEADARAIQLLGAQDISTRGMADFFGRMANRKDDPRLRRAAEWFATHPDTAERAHRAAAVAAHGTPALSEADWRVLKAACQVVRR